MIDNSSSALAEIRRMGLPEVFTSVWDNTVPTSLRSEWKYPHTYLRMCHDFSECVPALTGLCPLWEQYDEAIIGRLPDGRYVRFYYEEAGHGTLELLGSTYQQFVTTILTELVESGLWDRYDVVAALLGYEHTTELRAILESDCDDETLISFRDSIKDNRA